MKVITILAVSRNKHFAEEVRREFDGLGHEICVLAIGEDKCLKLLGHFYPPFVVLDETMRMGIGLMIIGGIETNPKLRAGVRIIKLGDRVRLDEVQRSTAEFTVA